MDTRLIELLVCPVCKGPLQREHKVGKPDMLTCVADRLGFPIRDGIPVMLESEAVALEEESPLTPAEILQAGATHQD